MGSFHLKVTEGRILFEFYNHETDSIEVIDNYPETSENIRKLVQVVYILNNEIAS